MNAKSWTVCVIEPNKFEGQIIADLLRNAGVNRIKVFTDPSAALETLCAYNAGVVIELLSPKERVLGKSKNWVWMQLEGVAPEGSRRLSINLHTQGQGGYVYFDDVYIGLAEK